MDIFDILSWNMTRNHDMGVVHPWYKEIKLVRKDPVFGCPMLHPLTLMDWETVVHPLGPWGLEYAFDNGYEVLVDTHRGHFAFDEDATVYDVLSAISALRHRSGFFMGLEWNVASSRLHRMDIYTLKYMNTTIEINTHNHSKKRTYDNIKVEWDLGNFEPPLKKGYRITTEGPSFA